MTSHFPSTPHPAGDLAAASSKFGNEFLSFKLGSEEYGIDILKVQEIRGYEQPTRMAGVPPFIKGVMNLRGIIVPIIDLRIKFALPSAEYNKFTIVIVLSLGGRVVGVVVDGVSDVITLNADQIKPPPSFAAAINTDHVVGLGTIEDRMLILMDIERLMASSEFGLAPSEALHRQNPTTQSQRGPI